MTDMADAVALAEDRSFAVDEWLKNLTDKHDAPIYTDGVWRFPAPEGEEQQ